MMRRRRVRRTTTWEDVPATHDIHEWVRSLPWVVERPYAVGTPGVRSFAVDCEPLGRDQLWLITGLPHQPHHGGLGIAVILPRDVAVAIEEDGWGRAISPMPPDRVLVTPCGDAAERLPEIEALVLSAYGAAMS
jgi:hypothetical protein